MNRISQSHRWSCALLLAGGLWAADAHAETPGTGLLVAANASDDVALPLLQMEVSLTISGPMLHGTVRQRFHNDASIALNARYLFPLPERAAVDALTITVGERTIEAVIKPRRAARDSFEAAQRAGQQAALVEQQAGNLFSTDVANIAPGATIDVTLSLLQELAPRDGRYEFAFPLTYTPRYRRSSSEAPPCSATWRHAPSGDAAAPTATVRVQFAAGLALGTLESPSHSIERSDAAGALQLTTGAAPIPLARDFVLRWTLARAREPQASLLVEDRSDGRYGLLVVTPPGQQAASEQGLPTETLFVIDVSGSMEGPSLTQARLALQGALETLRPGDSFNILKFSDENAPFQAEMIPVSSQSIEAAKRWVGALQAEGGTEIGAALARGLELLASGRAHREQRLILITDGAVEAEGELLAMIRAQRAAVRLHAVGIGAAPNRWLLRKLATEGRGTALFLDGADQVETGLGAFLARIARPVLADLAIDWHGAMPRDVEPRVLPDLYAGEPLVLSLQLDPDQQLAQLTLGGRQAGGWVTLPIAVDAAIPQGSGVATRWARASIARALDSLHEGRDAAEVEAEVLSLAIPFHLVTPYSSLVAVETSRSTTPAEATAEIPATMPEGLLPQGGTLAPLWSLIGLALSLLGFGGVWWTRRLQVHG